MLKAAVIGVGYLGRFHAQKYHQLPNVELVAVCDSYQSSADAVGHELNVRACYDYHELFKQVDMVSIAATTNQHFAIAKACLEQGIHVLIEKPMTETVEQANQLISLAEEHNLKLQVGHLERFNSARLALDPYLDNPVFIESERIAPFNPRGTDVNVVLDLMIHDIDIIQTIVRSPIINIEAYGMPIVTPLIDVANARLTFANQCIANVTASRVSSQMQRMTRIFQKNAYITVDYQEKKLSLYTTPHGTTEQQETGMQLQELTFAKQDALLEEIKAFVNSVENDTPTLVTGVEGRNALSTAAKITALIQENLQIEPMPA